MPKHRTSVSVFAWWRPIFLITLFQILPLIPQPSTLNHKPSITLNHKPSTINHRPSTINHRPSTINHRPSTINHQPNTLTSLLAATYTPSTLPIPYLQDKTQYVSNPDGILSRDAVDSLNIWLSKMEREHGVQTVLAVVEHIEGGDTYSFCMELGRKYGIGSKTQNSGLIILLATKDRAYYILTGRGLEGTLPDAICKRIENRQMLPSLREGDWDEAMLNTVRAIAHYVDGDDSLVGNSDFDDEGDAVAALFAMGFFLLAFLLIVFAVWYDKRQKSLCPSCHQHTMKRIASHATTNRLLGIRTHHDTYRCTQCGFTKLRTWDEDLRSGGGAAAGAAAGSILGGFSGRGGGGGFTGGHFGGGSFGGGGAGGRF